MNKSQVGRILCVLLLMSLAQLAHAGWNYGSRKNCKIFAKYRVEAHALYTTSGGGSGTVDRDTGCTWAHAGPVRYHTSNGLLLSEAEGYIGNNAFWGYARAWNHWDPGVNLYKKGIAGLPQEQAVPPGAPIAPQQCRSQQAASNHFFASDVVFTDAARGASASITLKGVMATFAGTEGYSVFEITVWRPADDLTKKVADTDITPAKTIWRAKAVVHGGRLSIEGDLPRALFAASTPTDSDREVVYTIENKDIVVPIPPNVNTETIEISIRGDAGDESILNAPARPVTIANLPMQAGTGSTPCPPLNTVLRRENAATVPYLAAVLPALDQRCASTAAGTRLQSVTFLSCTKDRRGALFGPNATATLTCGK